MRRVLLLLALAAVGLAAVSAAQAKVTTNDKASLAYAGFVPCANGGTGELLTGTIDVRTLSASTVNANDESWHFDFEAHGALTGATTGDTYRVAAVEHGTYTQSLGDDHSTLTYVNRYRLVGPGQGNNLVVRETAHVTIDADENVTVQHDDFGVVCA
jgi:hypothetical protein